MTILARWESRQRKHWVEAIKLDDGSFAFRADASGGFGYTSADAVIKRAELEASFYNVRMPRVL